MKICIVGPGHTAIPPVGWGAVESLIWDYKQTLESLGHNVLIVNNPNHQEIVRICDEFNPDFVHVQYDDHWPVCDNVKCDNVAITSHYAYLEQPDKMGGYIHTFQNFLRMKKVKIFALSSRIRSMYVNNGFDSHRIEIIPNGVREDLFRFDEFCLYQDRSLYLAKVDYRKRQYLFQNIPNLYFAGNIADNRFASENYLGEWSKDYLYENLTNYANLVLLSDGEAHPLVCLEAMCAGLGLVVSEWATANLDTDLPFIDIIPEFMINDIDYVQSVISKNRDKSIKMRNEIRKYAISNFSWQKIVKDYYIPAIYRRNL